MNSIVFGSWFFITYIISTIFNMSWIIIWVNEYIIWSAIFLCLITIPLIISAFISHKYMLIDIYKPLTPIQNADDYGGLDSEPQKNQNQNQNNKSIVPRYIIDNNGVKSWIYGTVLNGIPFYATWCVVASHLNIGIALCYKGGMSNEGASFLMLSILTCVIFFYWYLDFIRFRFYLRFTYSPYITLIVAFCGVLSNDKLDINQEPTSLFVLILLILAIIGFIGKIIMGCFILKSAPVQTKSLERV